MLRTAAFLTTLLLSEPSSPFAADHNDHLDSEHHTKPNAFSGSRMLGLEATQQIALLTRCLIEDSHSNAVIAWQAPSFPQNLTAEQTRLLEDASRLAPASDKTKVKSANGNTATPFKLAL